MNTLELLLEMADKETIESVNNEIKEIGLRMRNAELVELYNMIKNKEITDIAGVIKHIETAFNDINLSLQEIENREIES
jgi:hypothetical protein